MSSDPTRIDPIGLLIVGGGGLGGAIHRALGRALDTVPENERRLIRSIALDSDGGSFSATVPNQYQIGQITNTESGGHDDPSVVQAVVRRDDGRRTADSVMNRMSGARGDRRTGHKVFADDLATREQSVMVLGRELKQLDSMSPSRIAVLLFGSAAGAIGSNLVVVGSELVHEAARRAGIKSSLHVSVHCLSPSLVMADIPPQYLDENTVATLRDVMAITSGYPLTFLLHDVDPKPADELFIDDVNYRSWLLHSNSGAEEAQRAIPASLQEILRTAIDICRSDIGAIIRSNFINTTDPDSESVFRIAQGQGVYVPARDYADVFTARSVRAFIDLVARTKPNGEPSITSQPVTAFDREASAGPERAKVLFQEVHQSSLIAGADPDARVVCEGSWQRAVELLGADPDRTVFPIEEALPLKWFMYPTVDRLTIARFAEDLSNHHEVSIADANDGFGAMRRPVVAATIEHHRALFDRVLNGRGAYVDERNRAGLYTKLVSMFETHLNRVVASWREAFGVISTVHDGNGGLIDKRKLLTEQIEGRLAELSQSLVPRIAPFVGWAALREVRGLAAERLDIDLLDIAIQMLESMAADLRKELRIASEWAASSASILNGISQEALRRLAEAEGSLATAKSHGAAILVGEEPLRAALAVVQRVESERLFHEVQWSIGEGQAVGMLSTIALASNPRGASTPNEKNYELTSRSAHAGCRDAADQIDVTSCVAAEFPTPDRLLDTLRRCVNPEAEVELDGIKSTAQPAKSIVMAMPRAVAADAVAFFDQLKLSLLEEEKFILTDAREIRYISALANIPLQRLRLVCRAGRAYVTSERVLHVSEMLERSRLVSRELHRARGITWIPPIAIAGLLDDPATLRVIALAMSTGMVKGLEVKTKNGPLSVWSTSARKPSATNPPVTMTGLELVIQLRREPFRSDIVKVVAKFDAQTTQRRLDALILAEASLMTEPPPCLGDEKDLLRLIDIALLSEITRLQRTGSFERLGP
jgi:hypothetical protein